VSPAFNDRPKPAQLGRSASQAGTDEAKKFLKEDTQSWDRKN